MNDFEKERVEEIQHLLGFEKTRQTGFYKFFKDFIKAAGTKAELGYGLIYNDGSLTPTPFLKLKVIDKKAFDISAFMTEFDYFGGMVGVKVLKAGLKINLGVCTSLAKKIKISDVELKGFMGFSFKF